MKLIIKLVIVALVANAAWHVMSAYASFYKFKDSVAQLALFGNDKSIDMLRGRVIASAGEYDLPLGDDDFSVRRENHHTIVDGSYTRSIELVPGFPRPWMFPFHIDSYSEAPMTGAGREPSR
jgi:hypothetical protein